MAASHFVYDHAPQELGDDPIPQRGALAHVNRARDYLSSLEYWRFAPRNDLVDSGKMCLANPSREYVVYFPSGGHVTVDLTAATGALHVRWYNPRTGVTEASDPTTGGGSRPFAAPDTKDWVLHLFKEGSRD